MGKENCIEISKVSHKALFHFDGKCWKASPKR